MSAIKISKEERQADAYYRLQVTTETVAGVPQITHLLKRAKLTVKSAATFLRGSETPEARRWIAKYDLLGRDELSLVPFEAFCVSAGIPTRKMFSVLCEAVFIDSKLSGQLLQAAAHPDIMEKTIAAASSLSDGNADRKMLLQAMGTLPVGSKTVVFGTQNNVAGNQQNNTAILIPSEERTKRIQSRFGSVHPELPPAA